MTTQRTQSNAENREAKLYYLSKTDLFQDLSPDELSEVEHSVAMSSCRRGTVVFRPDEMQDVLFILKQGRVNLYRLTEDGRKFVTATIPAGTVFGEMSMVGQDLGGYFAEAVEDSVLCVLSRSDLTRLLQRYPSIAMRFLERLGQRLRETEDRLGELAYRPVSARIASALLRLAKEEGNAIPLSHQDIADMVGTYRETATRILNEMQEQGLIELGRLQIVVKRGSGLEQLAKAGA
jgi:CRP/FNR family transcriptional regulator, cyclic AMP receptor protein